MSSVSSYFLKSFLASLGHEPTLCQNRVLDSIAEFVTGDEDIMVVNGYAGTGKTTAMAAVISSLSEMKIPCVLLAPTGRAAKVLSSYTGRPAYTIHKHIYRQRAVSGDGFGEFSLAPNKSKNTLYIIDEASLIGMDSSSQEGRAAFGSGNLLEDLINFVRKGSGCKMILVGDSAQLPPVGLDCSPALNHDYMRMLGAVRFEKLSSVVRQKTESGILHNATIIRRRIGDGFIDLDGGPLTLETKGFDDVERIGGAELIEKISEAYDRYGDDSTVILCRSNKRALKYNSGIRSTVQFKEEALVRGDRLMIVKNCYQFLDGVEGLDYIANGDIATLLRISHYEERYGFHFAEARLCFPDYGNQEIVAKVLLDTLESESAALGYEQQNALYRGVNEDYSHIKSKMKRYEAVREDPYYNALQLKYANALTCHKSQGGQWDCVFVDNPFWHDDCSVDDLKWLYTAVTRAVKKLYLVNFKDEMFI